MTPVIYEQSARIVTLTLNRPDARNALSEDVVTCLVEGLERANADKAISCVILTGAGKGFSAGGNLRELRALTTERRMDEAQVEAWYRLGIQRIPQTLATIDVVTIAAIHGHAIGAGCDLAAMCDFRIATDSAFFAESFVRIGLISGDGGAWFLPRVVGLARAKEMMLSGQPIDAAKALRWGLVSSVVAENALLGSASMLAEQIASLPPKAVRATKQLLRSVEGMDLAECLRESARFQATLQLHPQHLEAIDSVLAERLPRVNASSPT